LNARLAIVSVVLIGATTGAWHLIVPLWLRAVTDWEHEVYFFLWLDPSDLFLYALLLLPSMSLGFLVVMLGRPRSPLTAGIVVGLLFCFLQVLRAKFSPFGDASLWRFDYRYWVCAVGLLGPVVGAGIAGLVPPRVNGGLPSNNLGGGREGR
jgi:hypothetical protein